ncbi:tripartite tricarboxylate transporter TctB family protein [Paraburkholderia sp. Ac-20342]|uniref:tripartite tricarboxylate transporter TctB family protein n=1 Tax=Paraburkholderia sp. Ac-20342 TaxID=2703889 RepID=UPI001981CB41|nr:tripartite tricarboxylate transporter TctB family protein [Paraburkholderia sp. Ac-20342]MBN3849594.1 tripartite tricarboxylate transporter TctB family protein [Paraburkholderia sp. Ac-20342]
MKITWRPSRDQLGGVLLMLLGVGVSIGGLSFHVGTLTDMGSGFIPLVLGVLMTLIGLAVILAEKKEEREAEQKFAKPEWRGWFCILAGVAAFVVVGTYGGLIPATFLTVLIAALGDKSNSMRDCLLLALAVTVFGVAVFGYGLGLQMPFFAWG